MAGSKAVQLYLVLIEQARKDGVLVEILDSCFRILVDSLRIGGNIFEREESKCHDAHAECPTTPFTV